MRPLGSGTPGTPGTRRPSSRGSHNARRLGLRDVADTEPPGSVGWGRKRGARMHYPPDKKTLLLRS